MKYFVFLLVAMICIMTAGAQHHSWNVPKDAEMMQNPYVKSYFTDNSLKSDSGEFHFNFNCVPCHGEKGKGNGAARASLEPRPANLITEHTQEESDGSLFWKISNGHAPMPSFKNTMTDDQIWQVITYFRYLCREENREKREKQK